MVAARGRPGLQRFGRSLRSHDARDEPRRGGRGKSARHRIRCRQTVRPSTPVMIPPGRGGGASPAGCDSEDHAEGLSTTNRVNQMKTARILDQEHNTFYLEYD